jgi:large conductance mechanosensitive channel
MIIPNPAATALSFGKEFREFLMRGNVLDLAVGVIIGAAFGGIVSSLVNDVIMPPLGVVLARVDFKDARIVLRPEAPDPKDPAKKIPESALSYGKFINALISFILTAAAVFLLIKTVNKLYRKPPPPPQPSKTCPECLESIHLAATRCKFCTAVQARPAPSPG